MAEKSLVKRKKIKIGEGAFGYFFIAPWLIGFFVFTVLPMAASLLMSFSKWNADARSIFSGFEGFIGFQNFSSVVKSSVFGIALRNTLLYMVFATLISIIFGLIIAYILLKNKWYNKVLRTVVYLPCLVIGVAFSMMMAPIFSSSQHSLINQLLGIFNKDSQSWLNQPGQAVWIMIIMAFWGLGSSMIVFIAGFKNVDKSYIEAAKIDGATDLQIVFRISIPLISYVIIYQVIMGIIYGMQVFDVPIGLAAATNSASQGMGMNNALGTLVYYIYRMGFYERQMAEASAAGWIIFFLSGGFTAILLLFIKKTKYYSVD